MLCALVSGALAGLAGVYLAIGHANTFLEGMTDGRGFIALAVVIFGRWQPWGVLAAALFFGLAQGLQFALQARPLALPYQFFQALPYLVTLAALVGRAGGTRAPAALARPYQRV
jgi:simple sugar transport system permease protein